MDTPTLHLLMSISLTTEILPPRPPAGNDDAAWHDAHEAFLAYLSAPDFPCTGAKSAMHTGRYEFALFDELGTRESAPAVCDALYRFISAYPDPGLKPVTFIAAFRSVTASEAMFEAQLWGQLQAMHQVDRDLHGWDPAVSSDPDDPDFSLSIGGTGFFVVGLHPHASRWARRAPTDTLVFNFHAQFAAMAQAGKYDSMTATVRQRDLRLQGTINPTLARHGEASEAIQYSGRHVDPAWKCPFLAGGRP